MTDDEFVQALVDARTHVQVRSILRGQELGFVSPEATTRADIEQQVQKQRRAPRDPPPRKTPGGGPA